MVFIFAVKAEFMRALAFHYWLWWVRRSVYNILTVIQWAPLHVLIRVYHLFAMPFHVDIKVIYLLALIVRFNFIFEVLYEEWVWYDQIALRLWTFCHHTSRPLWLHLILQKLSPAQSIILMSALKWISSPPIFIFELTKANLTHVPVVGLFRLIDLRVLLSYRFIVFDPNFDAQLVWIREPLTVNLILIPLEVS